MRRVFMEEMLNTVSMLELCLAAIKFDILQENQHSILQKVEYMAETILDFNELVENSYGVEE